MTSELAPLILAVVFGCLVAGALVGAGFAIIRGMKPASPAAVFCCVCGEQVSMTPTRLLIFQAHRVIFCERCVPAGTASQLAEISLGPRIIRPIARCMDCPADLYDDQEGEKHVKAGHTIRTLENGS